MEEDGSANMLGVMLSLAILVVLVSMVFAVIIGFGENSMEKPTFAAFKLHVTEGLNAATGKCEYPMFTFHQSSGATLRQEYIEGTHSGIRGTTVRITAPDGNQYEVVNSNTMTGSVIEPGKTYYVFCHDGGEGKYWITNDPGRVFSGIGVHEFLPHGKWILIISDEEQSNSVLFVGDVQL